MRAVLLLLWTVGAGWASLVALGVSLPTDLPDAATPATSVHMYWYMGRAGGFVAYGLLFTSVVLGLAVSSRVFDGLLIRSWVFETHQFLSLFVLIAMLFHALILLPDPYAQFKVEELLIPFESPYRPAAVAAGAIVLYGSVIVAASFYLKRFIGQRSSRALHYLAYALLVGAMVHGILAGTDSGEQWAQLTYLSSGLTVLFFTFFRILASRSVSRGSKPRGTPRGEPTPAQQVAPHS